MTIAELRERIPHRRGRGICGVCGAASLSLLDQATHIFVKAHCGCDWIAAIKPYGFDPQNLQATARRNAFWKRHQSCTSRVDDPVSQQQLTTQTAARERWNRAVDAAATHHPYLRQKKLPAFGLRLLGSTLLVPMRDHDKQLWSLQRIAPDGRKRCLSGRRPTGCYHRIGQPGGVVLIAEGYSTAAALHEATGICTVVAFGAASIPSVAKAIRQRTQALIALCIDNDPAGVAAAARTARDLDTISFPPPTRGHDWYDHLSQFGPENLCIEFADLMRINAGKPSRFPATRRTHEE